MTKYMFEFKIENYDHLEDILNDFDKLYCRMCGFKTIHFKRGTKFRCMKCEERAG
jgi:hypothetical protein